MLVVESSVQVLLGVLLVVFFTFFFTFGSMVV